MDQPRWNSSLVTPRSEAQSPGRLCASKWKVLLQVGSVPPVMANLPLVPCTPSWWNRTGHWQTIWGHILRSPELSEIGEKLNIALPDGDQLVAFCHEGPSNYVVSVYHGLSGDADADYIRRTTLLCKKLGHTCVRVNHRGAGAGAGLANKPYHSGRSQDISEVLKFLKIKFPDKKQITIGFSMSGNIILHLLSGRGDANSVLPDAAIVSNAAINLERTSIKLHKGFNRIYDRRFISILSKMVAGRVKVPRHSRVYDFDQLYTAPASGFRDREHYYGEASTIDFVSKIKTPVYVLTAEGDPFVAVEDYRQASWSSSTNLHIERHGGHLGFICRNKTPLGSHRWLDHYLFEALTALTAQV